MKLPGRHDPGSITGEFRPPEVEAARPGPVRRPMSVGANTDRFLPSWVGSVRFRLALLYSVLLFGLAAIVIGGIYAGISREIGRTIMDQPGFDVIFETRGGDQVVVSQLESFEAEVDRQVLEDLRRYSFAALALLFAASMAVGWYVAGIVLRPIERITAVARSINATDLTRRINLAGPSDELSQLADTFDDMLDRLDMAFSAQTRFIHEASHELRNPLAVIRTNLDVTLSDDEVEVEELKRMCHVVGRSAERMTTLVDDLLDHARQETVAKRVEVLDVAPLVRTTSEEFDIPAAASEIHLVVDTTDDLLVEGDPIALRRALANLLANAIRLAPAGSTISTRAGRVDDWVWMGVQDQGPGISSTDQQRVFRRLWRGDHTPVPKRDGRSGLGLAIVKQIAETHGGTVRVESEVGAGSTFVVWLPTVSSEPIDDDEESSLGREEVGDKASPTDSDDEPALTGPLPPPD
ncbi:MAG: sensor histidine kinase [Acidimicrobiales bacterium]